MQNRRWFNQAQPQTLQIATFLLYANSAFILLFLVLDLDTSLHQGMRLLFNDRALARIGMLALAIAQVAAGFGIANERKWSHPLAIGAVTSAVLINVIASFDALVELDIFRLFFDVALLVALLHPQSRDYRRIWFK